MSIIETLESPIGFISAVKSLKHGVKERDGLCTAESTFEVGGGVSSYIYYAGQVLSRTGIVLQVFLDHLPHFISVIGHVMAASPLRFSLGGVGICVNISRIVKESLSLIRQNRFLAIFQRTAWQGEGLKNAIAETIANFHKPEFLNSLPLEFRKVIAGKEVELQALSEGVKAGNKDSIKTAERVFALWTGRNIRDGLEEINNKKDVELKRALPEWLYNDIVAKGGKIYLSNLFKQVYKGDPKATAEATELLDKMRSYATKKRIVHVLKIIGSVIGLISCIGFFVAFPPGVTLVLLALIMIMAATAYMVSSGYVENREDRFSLLLCVPEFIRDLPETIKDISQKINTRINAKRAKKPFVHPLLATPRTQKITTISAQRLARQKRLVKHLAA